MSDESHWRDNATIVPIANLLKRSMSLGAQKAADQQPCYIVSWRIDSESCPETACLLRDSCQQGWQVWQTERAASVRPPPQDPSKVPRAIAEAPPKKIRGKYRGTTKYEREGYQPGQRFCDELLSEFLTQLPPLPVLPKKWARVHVDQLRPLGRAQMSSTVSFHGIYVDMILHVRVWTTSAYLLAVDLVPDIMVATTRLAERLGKAADGTPHLTRPVPTPERSWAKHRPCTHTIRIRTRAGAQAFAHLVKTELKL